MTDWWGEPWGDDSWDPADSQVGSLEQKYRWHAWGDSCAICTALHGRVYTLDFWANAGIWPGFHLNCDCTIKMVPDDTPTSDLDFWGTNIHQYKDMWFPYPNIYWDFSFLVRPFAVSYVEQIEEMHLLHGANTPIGEIMKLYAKRPPPGFFKYKDKVFGDILGWRIHRTMQHYQEVEGMWSGSNIIDLSWVIPVLAPYWRWLLADRTGKNYNKKSNYYRMFVPPASLRPLPLRPYNPYQSYYTEID